MVNSGIAIIVVVIFKLLLYKGGDIMISYRCPNCGRVYNYGGDFSPNHQCMNCGYFLKKRRCETNQTSGIKSYVKQQTCDW